MQGCPSTHPPPISKVHTGQLQVAATHDAKDAREVLCIEDCTWGVAGERDVDAHKEKLTAAEVVTCAREQKKGCSPTCGDCCDAVAKLRSGVNYRCARRDRRCVWHWRCERVGRRGRHRRRIWREDRRWGQRLWRLRRSRRCRRRGRAARRIWRWRWMRWRKGTRATVGTIRSESAQRVLGARSPIVALAI